MELVVGQRRQLAWDAPQTLRLLPQTLCLGPGLRGLRGRYPHGPLELMHVAAWRASTEFVSSQVTSDAKLRVASLQRLDGHRELPASQGQAEAAVRGHRCRRGRKRGHEGSGGTIMAGRRALSADETAEQHVLRSPLCRHAPTPVPFVLVPGAYTLSHALTSTNASSPNDGCCRGGQQGH